MRMSAGIVLLVIAQDLAGCSSTAPTLVRESTPPAVVVFTDPASGFSTSDLRDAQGHVVQLNQAHEFIWAATGAHYPGYWGGQGSISITGAGVALQVRFGNQTGERRAYLTWYDDLHYPGPLVDIEVAGGTLVITNTNEPVPGT